MKKKELVVRHDAIPGYMDAMVMHFSVRDVKLFDRVTPGDVIRFRLFVTEKEDWIGSLEVIAHGKPADVRPATAAPKPGDALPLGDIRLVDEQGRAFPLSSLHGQAVALTFFFTRCPFPKMCPLLSSKFAAVQNEPGVNLAARKDWLLLSVTIDP